MMKIKIPTVIISLFMSLCGLSVAGDRPPNIIVVMVDDMGVEGLSCYENKYFKTPEIDKLAAEGMRFTDFHSNGIVCTPTRAALMTGRYQYRTGMYLVCNANPEHKNHIKGLPSKEWTFAEALKENGYATAIFGKWHIGYLPEFNPVRHGFDIYIGFKSGNIDGHSHYDGSNNLDWWQNEQLKNEPGYYTDLWNEDALEFIRANKDRPFFIYYAHAAPHGPVQARGSKIVRGPDKDDLPPWAERGRTYSKAPSDENYLVRHVLLPVDEGVGMIRREIEKLGLAEDTIIWFTSDNGWTKNHKMINPNRKGAKGTNYEGGHLVPGIVWAPGRVSPGVSSELVTTMDIMPTSLAMAEIKVPEAHPFDGIDIRPALCESKSLAERPIIWGVFQGDRGTFDENIGALRRGSWKLVENELYNLDEDPGEATDLAEKYPERVQQMIKERTAILRDAISDSPYEH